VITFVPVMSGPVFPTERGHPKPIDKDDRGDVHRENWGLRASRSAGNSSRIGGRKLNAAKLLMSSGLCL